MLRTALLTAAAIAMISVTAAPAFAGPAETAYLQKLNASWTGRGKVVGGQGGSIACRIVFSSSGQSAKYQGRCNIPDMATQAFNGAISYNDAKGRYESRSLGGTVPGVKRGNSLVFTTKDTSMGGTAYSTMTISPASLVVDFSLIDRDGGKTSSRVTFSK